MSDKSNPYGAPDTGHVWDDNLRELTNPPPKWWMLGLHASWILVVVYTIVYPSWPLVNSHFKGVIGWTSIGEYKEDLKAIETVRAKHEVKIAGLSASEMAANTEMKDYIKASAKVLFGDNCAACHGSGGQGNPGYPSLADDDWLWGGDIDTIVETITKGRKGNMPAHAESFISDEELDQLATAILNRKPTESPLYTSKGCVACHGADGKGQQKPFASANLTDAIWRFQAEDQLASIKYTIRHGVNQGEQSRNAVMPAFGGGKLSETDIAKLAVFVSRIGSTEEQQQ